MTDRTGWTLFLDRDGVINKKATEHDYIKSWEEFEFLPGAIDAVSVLKKIFRRIVVVSNQQGVGKGILDPFMLQTIHERMTSAIISAGGDIDLYLHCPHLESDNCSCRKPRIGMAIKAKRVLPEIDFSKSVMVGDSESDMEFGKRLGMVTVRVIPGGKGVLESKDKNTDYACGSLLDYAIQER